MRWRNFSSAEKRARKDGVRPCIEGREDFIRENAMALLEERDVKIANMRAEITKLQRSRDALRKHVMVVERERALNAYERQERA